jgi:hypothetical protein
MDVSAHFLSRLSRSKDADDGHFGLLFSLQEMRVFAELGVISSWCGLILVDAVQPQAKHVHLDAIVE